MIGYLIDRTIDARTTRVGLLLLVLAVFLLVPLRIMGYGYMPPDDALRHAAFAMTDRVWGDVILLDARFPAWMDPHAGWHAFLRGVHKLTLWNQSTLVSFSVVLALWVFTFGGIIASANPPAWLFACTLLAVLEPSLFLKLALGRPLFFSMTAVMLLLFVWTRRQPLRRSHEIAVVATILSVSLYMHPTSWYLWLIAVPPLAVCRQWRALASLAAGWGAALVVTVLLIGWYNGIALPLDILQSALLQGGTLAPNLVSELQPSGAPIIGLVGMVLIMLVRTSMGHNLRGTLLTVDFVFVITAWVMGLYVTRFWIEWGLPALAVWYTRQIGDGMGVGFGEGPRQSVSPMLVGVAAATFYLSQTVDLGGRYSSTLRNPLVIASDAEIATELPEAGGVLYSTDMRIFYTIFYRFPKAKFRFSTGMEPGLMPVADLEVLRDIQTRDVISRYKPWFKKMRPADRVMIRNATKPEWPGMEFKPFYGAWMGRKVSQ